MPRNQIVQSTEELILHFGKDSTSPDQKIDPELLKKNNLSQAEWSCFTHLVEELDLNTIGVKILLEEVLAGRVVLTCN